MELFPQAERGFLILIDRPTKRLIRKAFKYRPNKRSVARSRPYTDEVPMSISRSIVNHVIGQKKAVLSQDAGNDKDLPTSASIADLKIRSVMCVPLLTPDGEVLGIIQLDTSDRQQFLQDDLDVLAAVAGQAADRRPERLDAREAAAATPRSTATSSIAETGPEAVPAAVGAQDPRLRVLRLLPADLRGRRRLLRLRPASRRTGWGSRWATSRARGWPRP